MELRRYGSPGRSQAARRVCLLHGGPGARGHMAPVARELAARGLSVLEPLQRLSGSEPLTVGRHVADLDELMQSAGEAAPPPALVGSSWGAMLALAYAAAHPERAGPIVLIGCGTFDGASRAEFKRRLHGRLGEAGRRRLEELRAIGDPDQRLGAIGDFLTPFYSHDLLSADLEIERNDGRGNTETWADMIRLQEAGTYPQAFSDLRSPVLMLHGAGDPHPGAMIRDSLLPRVRRLEYVELDRCGHYPWLERHARRRFFETLEAWLRAAR